jgi:hypothetical protein
MLPPHSPEDYEKHLSDAETAVSAIADPALRGIAFRAILAHKLSGDIAPASNDAHPFGYFSHPSNSIPVLAALALATAACLSLWLSWPGWISAGLTIFMDVIILGLLLVVTLHSDKRTNKSAELPHRLPALFIGALLFVGLIHSFANMYVRSQGICPGGRLCAHFDPTEPTFEKPGDALYFSCVTMTTVGYGDFAAGTPLARYLVIWQLANTVFLMVVFLPLVLSRIADF